MLLYILYIYIDEWSSWNIGHYSIFSLFLILSIYFYSFLGWVFCVAVFFLSNITKHDSWSTILLDISIDSVVHHTTRSKPFVENNVSPMDAVCCGFVLIFLFRLVEQVIYLLFIGFDSNSQWFGSLDSIDDASRPNGVSSIEQIMKYLRGLVVCRCSWTHWTKYTVHLPFHKWRWIK